jgi:uncharacterized membrane protein
MNRRAIRALYADLPELTAAGILTEDTAKRLREHYGEAPEVSRTAVAVLLFAILGSALIAAGIILLFAHNWDQLGRTSRTVLSFTPLLAAQALGLWVLFRRPSSAGWCESAAVFLVGGIGVAIALIAQTYHIAGDEASFFLTWSILVLPCVYLFRSVIATLASMAGFLTWAGLVQQYAAHAVGFWPLTLLLAPMIVQALRQRESSPTAIWLTLGTLAYLTIGVGIVLEKTLPGLWIIAYASLMTLFSLGARLAHTRAVRLPAQVVGYAGGIFLLMFFTYSWVWDDIGPRHYRVNETYHAWAGVHDYVVCLVLPILVVLVTLKTWRAEPVLTLTWAAFPFIASLGYAAVVLSDSAGVAQVLINVYMALAGCAFLASGLRSGALASANYGMLMIALLAIARFFDSDLGFVLRGILFILAGIFFLALNLVMLRRQRKMEAQHG